MREIERTVYQDPGKVQFILVCPILTNDQLGDASDCKFRDQWGAKQYGHIFSAIHTLTADFSWTMDTNNSNKRPIHLKSRLVNTYIEFSSVTHLQPSLYASDFSGNLHINPKLQPAFLVTIFLADNLMTFSY